MDVFIDLLLSGGLRRVSLTDVTGNWGASPATTGETATENGPTLSGKAAAGFLSATVAVTVKVAGMPAAVSARPASLFQSGGGIKNDCSPQSPNQPNWFRCAES